MVNSSVRTVSKPASTSATVYIVAQMLSVFLMVIIGKTSAQYMLQTWYFYGKWQYYNRAVILKILYPTIFHCC